jgi:diamine N-acetyltransferase
LLISLEPSYCPSVGAREEIRELGTEEELAACARVLRLAFGTVAEEFGLTEENAPTNAAFTTAENIRHHLDDGMLLYGLYRDGELIGSVAIKAARSEAGVFYVERLAVSPTHRHQGHGGRLLSVALERIRNLGGTTAALWLIDDNERLKQWYRSKGFVERNRRRVAHLPFKVCYMSRALEAGGPRPRA